MNFHILRCLCLCYKNAPNTFCCFGGDEVLVKVVDGGSWTRCRTTEAGAGLWAAAAVPALWKVLQKNSKVG